MKTPILTSLAIAILVGLAPNVHAQCQDPTNPDCISTNSPSGTNVWTASPVTNAVGYPVIRIASLRTSAATNSFGDLVSTNRGFTITTNNTIESINETTGSLRLPWTWATLGVINTSSNRQYIIEVSTDGVDGYYFPIQSAWNGIGTNEHIFATPSPITNIYSGLYFKVHNVGPAQ